MSRRDHNRNTPKKYPQEKPASDFCRTYTSHRKMPEAFSKKQTLTCVCWSCAYTSIARYQGHCAVEIFGTRTPRWRRIILHEWLYCTVTYDMLSPVILTVGIARLTYCCPRDSVVLESKSSFLLKHHRHETQPSAHDFRDDSRCFLWRRDRSFVFNTHFLGKDGTPVPISLHLVAFPGPREFPIPSPPGIYPQLPAPFREFSSTGGSRVPSPFPVQTPVQCRCRRSTLRRDVGLQLEHYDGHTQDG